MNQTKGFLQRYYDLVVVGGGIVGLATAREYLTRHPGTKVVVVEKESAISSHQSGHNSGVIHTGIYYPPGSLKAKLCVAGHDEMISYCRKKGIPFNLCGKVIVALDETEIPRLENLFERGIANGVQGLEMIGPERLRKIEPYAAGIKAIYSPNTGIIDFRQVARAYLSDIEQMGGEIRLGTTIKMLRSGKPAMLMAISRVNENQGEEIQANQVITCGGLQSDKLAQMTSTQPKRNEVRIIPFRGDYYTLKPEKRHMVKALIYPVPDPQFPFLGVHFTRVMNGEVWAGPNAVLAFAREGYSRWQLNLRDLGAVLAYAGFWRMAAKYWKSGLHEMYLDYRKPAYVKALRRYLPEITGEDLVPGHSGVRAQALAADGRLVDDFLIRCDENIIHVQNAPSPAATSSLVIGRMIVDAASQNS